MCLETHSRKLSLRLARVEGSRHRRVQEQDSAARPPTAQSRSWLEQGLHPQECKRARSKAAQKQPKKYLQCQGVIRKLSPSVALRCNN